MRWGAIAVLPFVVGCKARPAPDAAPDAGARLAHLDVGVLSNPVGPCPELPLLGAWLSPRPTSAALWSRGALDLQAHCSSADPGACRELGHMVEEGEGAPADLLRAELLYRSACTLGDIEACTDHAMVIARIPEHPTRGDVPGLLERACGLGSKRGCAALVIAVHEPKAAATELEGRCVKGEAEACGVLRDASRRWAYDSRERTHARDVHLAERRTRCEAGDVDACLVVAARIACVTKWWSPKRDVCDQADGKEADTIATRLCRAKDLRGCAIVARRARDRGAVDESKTLETDLLGRCARGETASCVAMASFDPPAQWGGDVKYTEAAARILCAASFASGCRVLRDAWDRDEAAMRGCLLGDDEQCSRFVENTLEANRDAGLEMPGFRVVLQTKCSLGTAPACAFLSERVSSCAKDLRERTCFLGGDADVCSPFAKSLPVDDARRWRAFELACRDRTSDRPYSKDEEAAGAMRAEACTILAKHFDDAGDLPRAGEAWAMGCLQQDKRACATLADRMRTGRGMPIDRERADRLAKGERP